MKGKMIFVFAIAMMAMAGMQFATPLLQVTNYTTVPTDVYPGTLGYLQITLQNKGDATAQASNAHYAIDGVDHTLSIGDIGAGSSAQISVPFQINQNAAGSIQIIGLTIYYNYQTTTNSVSSLQTEISVPLTVKQYQPLEVRTVSIGNTAIAPGEKMTFELALTNNGGVVNNLLITVPSNSTFTLDGTTQETVGSMLSNSTMNVSVTLASSSDTKTGTYSVPLIFTYMDALNQPNSETLSVGPISVLDASSQYRLDLVPLSTVEIGAQVPFDLALQNTGSDTASGMIEFNTTAVFTPLGAQKVYFDSVPAGETVHKNVTIGVGSSTAAGYYTLPILLTTNTGQEVPYNVGLQVEATPEITVTLDTTGSTPSVQVANTGNSQIRSVYATATPEGSQTSSESFMGTLNVDDFAALSLGSGATGRSVNVSINFRDSNNMEHTITTTLAATAGNSTFVQGTRVAGGAAGAAGNFAGRSSNPLGFLLGGNRAAAGGATGGIGIVPIVIIVVVVAGAGYLIYRKYYAKKGTAPKKSPLEIIEGLKQQDAARKKAEQKK